MTTESAEHKIDRADWPSGPWDNEPDREEWRAHGFPCLIVRNNVGGLCGYVGLPPGHPHHGVTCGDVPAEVHGGLTFSDKCHGPICHVPQAGESDEVWWLGFDCVHLGDAYPSARTGRMNPFLALGAIWERDPGSETYKTIEYVRAETEKLAAQMAEAAK